MYPFMGKIISQGKKMLGSKREPQRLGTGGTAVQTIQRTPDFAFTYQWLQVVGYKNAEVKNTAMGRQVGTVSGMRRYPDGWHGELQMYPWIVSTGIKLMPKTKNPLFPVSSKFMAERGAVKNTP